LSLEYFKIFPTLIFCSSFLVCFFSCTLNDCYLLIDTFLLISDIMSKICLPSPVQLNLKPTKFLFDISYFHKILKTWNYFVHQLLSLYWLLL
jgi:hypothetical protein